MSKFPKRYCLPDGSIYLVSLENVRDDWALSMMRLNSLSEDEQRSRIAAFDEEHAESWMADQWYGADIVNRGTDTGEVDENVREAALLALKRSQDESFASSLEITN